jgi:hypothetical protein
MMQDLLPLATPRSTRRRQAMNVDDLGRVLDRCRILLGSAMEELDTISDIIGEAGPIADQLEHLKAEVVHLWDGLPEPELPLVS